MDPTKTKSAAAGKVKVARDTPKASKPLQQSYKSGDQPSALDDVWQKALEEYKKEHNVSEEDLILAGDFGDANNRVQKANQLFENWRHPGDQKDKVAKAVAGCLDWVDTAVGFVQDHVDGTYATPVKIIGGAITKMIKAAKDVTEDLDLIAKTFVDIDNAMRDIGLLKERSPVEDHFTDRLTAIFKALFDFCSFSTTMFVASRKRRWVRALIKGRDEKIQAKCDDVKTVILLFRATVPLKILNMVDRIDKKVDELPENIITAFRLSLRPADLQILALKDDSQKKVRQHFGVKVTTTNQIETNMESIRSTYVKNTFAWLKDDQRYKTWFKAQRTPFLCVTGSQGTGKTYFTYQCCQLLLETIKDLRQAGDPTKSRQTISVAYFFFDPGKQETQSVRSAIQHLIVQIAKQDAKFCESIVIDIAKTKKTDPGKETAETLWSTFMAGKFEKKSDSSRIAYILLDGVDQLNEQDSQILQNLFKDLACDKTAIQVMMTGDPEKLKGKNFMTSEIRLAEMTRAEGDIRTIIEDRFKKSETLKSFKPETRERILKNLDEKSDGVISFVDLTLSVMEQRGDETAAEKEMGNPYNPKALYKYMIDVVTSGRSYSVQKSIETLYAWCTYGHERLSVHEIQQLWTLDTSLGKFNVLQEIQGKSKSMLYAPKRLSPDEEPDSVGQRNTDEDEPKKEPLQPEDGTLGATTGSKLNEAELQIVEFRQPALREYLDTTPGNLLIPKPSETKVEIFIRLCGILCDNSPAEAESRKVLHKYATTYFADHLNAIDPVSTTPQQGKEVVEALSRVMRNENEVCTIFETTMQERGDYYISFALYDDTRVIKKILAWAKKMHFYEDEELSPKAKDWVKSTIKDPRKMFKSLARGHIESLSGKVSIEEATLRYGLAYRALVAMKYASRRDDAFWFGSMNVQAAGAILKFSKDWLNENPINRARTRTSLALLLNASINPDDRKKAVELYSQNLDAKESAPGPERFYSLVGLAEYNASPFAVADTPEDNQSRWQAVLEHADLALQQRKEEMEALGSELDNERCATAFWLKAQAEQNLNHDDNALAICKRALGCNTLGQNELEYAEYLLKFVTMIIDILAKDDRNFEIVKEFQCCPHQMKVEWLMLVSTDAPENKHALRKAAVMARRVDWLIQLYKEAIDHWYPRDSYEAQILGYDLAVVYRHDARVTKMAELTLSNITEGLWGRMSQFEARFILQRILGEMVDIIFENFTVARSTSSKEVEVTKLKTLITKATTATGLIDSMLVAEAHLILAKMLRSLNEIQQAKAEADKAFNLCINDLEDLVSYNDYTAFRLLAKTLMFAGLEQEAGISLSLYNSDVDKDRDDNASEWSPSDDEDRDSVMSGGSDNASLAETHISANVVTEEKALEPNSGEDQTAVVNNVSNKLLSKEVNGLSPLTQNGNSELVTQDPAPSPVNGATEHEQSVKIQPGEGLEEKAVEGSEHVTAEKLVGDPAKNEQQVEQSEDLIPEEHQGLGCNGLCRPSRYGIGQDRTPMYYCLDCHDVDFCPACHKIQDDYYTANGEGFWFKCCWAKHQFLQQPVKDWHGVLDGVIRVGAKQKPYKLWIQGVKDKWSRKLALLA